MAIVTKKQLFRGARKLIGVVAKEIENEEEKKMIVTNLSFKEKNMKKFISNKC